MPKKPRPKPVCPVCGHEGINLFVARRMWDEGFNYQQIADHFGVTKAAAWKALNKDKLAEKL